MTKLFPVVDFQVESYVLRTGMFYLEILGLWQRCYAIIVMANRKTKLFKSVENPRLKAELVSSLLDIAVSYPRYA